jgi:hypothetical protein
LRKHIPPPRDPPAQRVVYIRAKLGKSPEVTGSTMPGSPVLAAVFSRRSLIRECSKPFERDF